MCVLILPDDRTPSQSHDTFTMLRGSRRTTHTINARPFRRPRGSCVHGLAQATDWQQQWCIEFALDCVLLGTRLRSSTSCATLSNALLRARASVTRDGPRRAMVRCWSVACDEHIRVRERSGMRDWVILVVWDVACA